MTNSSEALDPYRARVSAEVQALLDGGDLTHVELLRQHVGALAAGDMLVFDAAALHLLTVESLGGRAETALPIAASLALLSLSTHVMRALAGSARQPAGVLESSWGMPRTLNAGDAFYAMAQQSAERLKDAGMAPEDVMKASSLLRVATFGLC